MKAQVNTFENLLDENGQLEGHPVHPYKILFQRTKTKLIDVAYHCNVQYANLVAWLNGYGSIGKEARQRLKDFATVIEIWEQQQLKKCKKKNTRTKSAKEK